MSLAMINNVMKKNTQNIFCCYTMRASDLFYNSIHPCIHTCIHTYIHTYIHTCIHTGIYTCIHTYIHTEIHTYTYTMHTYIQTETENCTYTHSWAFLTFRLLLCSGTRIRTQLPGALSTRGLGWPGNTAEYPSVQKVSVHPSWTTSLGLTLANTLVHSDKNPWGRLKGGWSDSLSERVGASGLQSNSV